MPWERKEKVGKRGEKTGRKKWAWACARKGVGEGVGEGGKGGR